MKRKSRVRACRTQRWIGHRWSTRRPNFFFGRLLLPLADTVSVPIFQWIQSSRMCVCVICVYANEVTKWKESFAGSKTYLKWTDSTTESKKWRKQRFFCSTSNSVSVSGRQRDDYSFTERKRAELVESTDSIVLWKIIRKIKLSIFFAVAFTIPFFFGAANRCLSAFFE